MRKHLKHSARLTSLLAALLFVWLGGAHAHGRVLAAVDPIALSGAVGEICGFDGAENPSYQGHCPLCVLEAATDIPAPVDLLPVPMRIGTLHFLEFAPVMGGATARGTLGARGPPRSFT